MAHVVAKTAHANSERLAETTRAGMRPPHRILLRSSSVTRWPCEMVATSRIFSFMAPVPSCYWV